MSTEEHSRREEPAGEEGREESVPSAEGEELVSDPVSEPVGVPEGFGMAETPPDPEAAEEEELEAEPEEASEIAREEILALSEELELARRERDEYLDDMRRMKAELENSRKRLERERARIVELASEGLVRELLPVLDNLERALEVEGDIKEGVQATREQFVAVLAREGLSPIASDGQSFDPAFHEAVMSRPSDEHEEDTVIQTLERGYVLNGRPIRAAKVIVAG